MAIISHLNQIIDFSRVIKCTKNDTFYCSLVDYTKSLVFCTSFVLDDHMNWDFRTYQIYVMIIRFLVGIMLCLPCGLVIPKFLSLNYFTIYMKSP